MANGRSDIDTRTGAALQMNAVGIAADADNASAIRKSIERWLRDTPFDEDRRGDIVLAVYEAVANAVEHAYATDCVDRRMDVRAAYSPFERCLQVSVSDNGSWKVETPDERRGRGLVLIGALSDQADVFDTNVGTTVLMKWHLFGGGSDTAERPPLHTGHAPPRRNS